MAKTSEEKTIDRFLTLYIINECSKTHSLRGVSETKLQKLVFLSELKLIQERYKGFNYKFIRLLHPTFSSELRSDLRKFVTNNYLRGKYFTQTKKMHMILEDFNHLFVENKDTIEIIDHILSNYCRIPTNTLIHKVKKMTWGSGTIEDLSLRTPMLWPLKKEKAQNVFKISEDELENLMICLDPQISSEINKGFNDIREGRVIPHEKIFREL